MNASVHEERRQTCTLPAAYLGSVGLLRLKHEEDCITWFWAFPDLWPWPRPVSWIYTPVKGERCGDLWGIDSLGELLFIECKRRWSGTKDPFGRFPQALDDERSRWTSTAIRDKWERGFKYERELPDVTKVRLDRVTGGILPRSNHRQHIARWPQLAELIQKGIHSGDYENRVREALRVREAREKSENPLPHFFGLMATKSLQIPALTQRGIGGASELRRRIGATGTIGLVRAYAMTESNGDLSLAARWIPESEWGIRNAR